MNRKILLQVTMPAVLIGLLLFGACAVSAWYVNRLQKNLADILAQNVTSQRKVQELEIRIRQLRYHSFLYLIDPSPDRQGRIAEDHHNFEAALAEARAVARSAEERELLQQIDDGYRKYDQDIEQLLRAVSRTESAKDLAKLADAHPLGNIVRPSEELLELNKDMMEESAEESKRVAKQAQMTLILLGLLGPAGGLIAGYGIARGLSRSIYQLSVRVRDMAHTLDQDVASVSIEAGGDLQSVDRQLQHVVRRVEEVTERQQRHQREMLRAEQLAAVGQLAAGVAHEVRNPLTSVKMLVEVALRSENRKPLSLEDLRVIHGEIVRLEQTVQGLLDFARLPAPQRAACDLRDVVAQAVELVQVRAGQQRVEIELKAPKRPMITEVDAGQLRTVLINLFLNALDAMPAGGRLLVTLAGDQEQVRVEVADTGNGIPPEIAGRLFTPFATTKATGTGLGLSISRRIVEEHGGTLTAANRSAGGACFTLTLPCEARAV
jgi:signal transduction histidine kinase